ncbi:MAG: HesB/IscA family protein [Myxococcota bacterium]
MANLISIGRKKGHPTPAEAPEVVEVPSGQIAVTQRAAREIAAKLDAEGKANGVFRVGIMGGGCSGLTYLFRVEDQADDRDWVLDAHGVRVVVDPKSLRHLEGTLLDWHEELGKRGFEMRNPHVKSSCSCGSSFTL